MSADSDHEPSAEDSRSLIAYYEARLSQAGTFAWAVPPLALAGQAFLFSIALDPNTRPGAKALADGAGFVILLASLHFLGKHTFNFDWAEAALERERERLGWRRLTRDRALADIKSFPPDTLLRQREWWAEEDGERPFYRPWAKVRNKLIVRVKAIWVWSGALGILAIMDVGLLIDALIDLP